MFRQSETVCNLTAEGQETIWYLLNRTYFFFFFFSDSLFYKVSVVSAHRTLTPPPAFKVTNFLFLTARPPSPLNYWAWWHFGSKFYQQKIFHSTISTIDMKTNLVIYSAEHLDVSWRFICCSLQDVITPEQQRAIFSLMYRSCLTGETFSCKILIFLHIFHTTIFSVFYSKASKINFSGMIFAHFIFHWIITP